MPGYGHKKSKMSGTRAKSRTTRGGATRSKTRSTTRSTRSAGGARGSVRAAASYSAKKKKR